MSIRNTTRISTYHPIRGAHPAYMIDHINALMAPISLWPLREDSGTRKDMRADNNLTDNNTVTGNPGPSVNIPLASQFTALNSEYLSVADNANVSMGSGVRMSICAWAYKDSSPASGLVIAGQNAGAPSRGYVIFR